uniref:Potassium channel n=1 Tax=Salix viminalis TaxID=40686 RepID=A0A6N2LQ56_SALVM
MVFISSSTGLVIHPDNRWYRAWTQFILLWAVYSSFFTPMEFGFFRGLPENLFILDIVGQIVFLLDIILHFFVAYRDSQTYRMIYKRTPIALRYLKSHFIIDLLGCLPWDIIFKVCGRREPVSTRVAIPRLLHCRISPSLFGLKISQTLYTEYIEKVPLLKDCSAEFINQIVIRLHEEFFLPGEEEVGVGQDGSEETVKLLPRNSSFGEISILCNIPQPYTVRVCELCRLLRIDKQSLSNILEIYFYDGRKILDNLLEGKESNLQYKHLESDITFHIGKQEAELALRVNSAAYHGDLYQLKGFIRAGADPNRTDYDGRSPLRWMSYTIAVPYVCKIALSDNSLCIQQHLAASRGYEDTTLFLIQEGVDINIKDKFGNTPLLEAIKNGHDRVSSLLSKQGAILNIDDAGVVLCRAVARGDSDFLKRILSSGINPNSKDYDHRTPLHVAASEGLYLMARLLIEAGASVFSKDSTDERGVFPFHPWGAKEQRRPGVVLWIPLTMEELVKVASEKLQFPDGSCILSEDAGKILEVDMIDDGQKLKALRLLCEEPPTFTASKANPLHFSALLLISCPPSPLPITTSRHLLISSASTIPAPFTLALTPFLHTSSIIFAFAV